MRQRAGPQCSSRLRRSTKRALGGHQMGVEHVLLTGVKWEHLIQLVWPDVDQGKGARSRQAEADPPLVRMLLPGVFLDSGKGVAERVPSSVRNASCMSAASRSRLPTLPTWR